MHHARSPQWMDKGAYKEPSDEDKIRVPCLEIDDASTYLDKDGSNNLVLVDVNAGTKTLSGLAAMGSGGTAFPASPNDYDFFHRSDEDNLYIYIPD